MNSFKQKTGRDDYYFDQFFQHRLQSTCKEYRVIDNQLDNYLTDKKELHSLYLNTKDFILKLEDNTSNSILIESLSDSLRLKIETDLLESIRKHIIECKNSSILSIILVYTNGFTFRVRYFDFETGEPEFQIDVIYYDNQDNLIDAIQIKSKKELMNELKERVEFNKKVESGEIKLPPPPGQ